MLAGNLSPERGGLAVTFLGELGLTRYPQGDLLSRIWALREDFTAYDAAYVALAEVLEAPLGTADRLLAVASGSTATIELI